MFLDWLARQRTYQAETYGVDYHAMESDAERLTEYVTMTLHATVHELVEAGQETPWKPWATVDKAEYWRDHRDKFVGEMVDVLFFVGNALAAVNCTDEELTERYESKMAINHQRQAVGYDGQNKCVECGRAFDDAGVFNCADGNKVCLECAGGANQ